MKIDARLSARSRMDSTTTVRDHARRRSRRDCRRLPFAGRQGRRINRPHQIPRRRIHAWRRRRDSFHLSRRVTRDCVRFPQGRGRIWKRYQIRCTSTRAPPIPQNAKTSRIFVRGHSKASAMRSHESGAQPDVGEARVHPTAGAHRVGARKFLIAITSFSHHDG